MRLLLNSTGRASTSVGGTAFSVATHAALIAAAVYGTSVRSRELDREIAERISFIRYLPPPDRMRSTEHRDEAIRYVQQGIGGVPLIERPDGVVYGAAGTAARQVTGGARGISAETQAPSRDVTTADSVYSILDVEEAATRTAGSAAPIYPPALLHDRTEGSVLVQFVVDTLGRSDSASIVVETSTHPAFTRSVRHAIPLMTFSPATAGGRKVRQLVEQRFGFRVTPIESPAGSPPKPVP
ncbi:MAG: energy transducer TonB [Gemmatimonadota bacterium]|nr:energy transducer TonB [Gemmatimonadota bacterium]